jgi:predicted phage tail protein
LQSKFPSERVSLSNSIPVSNSNIKQNAREIANSFWSNVDYDLNSTDDIYLLNSVTRDIESNLAQLESSRKPSNQETNLFSALKVDENEDELASLISVTSSSDSTPNSSKSTSIVLSAVLQKKTERLADSTQDELNKLIEYCDSILEFFKAKDPKCREYTASLSRFNRSPIRYTFGSKRSC